MLHYKNISIDSRILVTGGSGGLGTHVINRLKSQGATNILSPNSDELNLLSASDVNAYFKSNDPEYVIHLAAVVYGLGGHIESKLKTVFDNTRIDHNVFAAIASSNVKSIFYAGTVASYPYPYRELPLHEGSFFNGLPHQSEFGYALAKRHAYSYLALLNQQSSVNFSYGIFTNLYGEFDRFNTSTGHVIPSLIAKAHLASSNSLPLKVWGNPSSTRDFLHFEDAASAILLTLDNPVNSVVNISSGFETSMDELVRTIVEVSNCQSYEYVPNTPVGIPRRVVSNVFLNELGFQQNIDLNKGISRLYAWYCNNFNVCRV